MGAAGVQRPLAPHCKVRLEPPYVVPRSHLHPTTPRIIQKVARKAWDNWLVGWSTHEYVAFDWNFMPVKETVAKSTRGGSPHCWTEKTNASIHGKSVTFTQHIFHIVATQQCGIAFWKAHVTRGVVLFAQLPASKGAFYLVFLSLPNNDKKTVPLLVFTNNWTIDQSFEIVDLLKKVSCQQTKNLSTCCSDEVDFVDEDTDANAVLFFRCEHVVHFETLE